MPCIQSCSFWTFLARVLWSSLKTYDFQNVLTQYNNILLQSYSVKQKWLLLDLNGLWTDKWGENVLMKMNSDVTLATQRNNTLSLYDLYDPGLGMPRNFTKTGEWQRSGEDCAFLSSKTIYEKRRNMTGVVVRVAFLVTRKLKKPIWEYLMGVRNKKHDTISKFNYALFQNIIQEYNFT